MREYGTRRETWAAFSERGSPLASPCVAQRATSLAVSPMLLFSLLFLFRDGRLATEGIYRVFPGSCGPLQGEPAATRPNDQGRPLP